MASKFPRIGDRYVCVSIDRDYTFNPVIGKCYTIYMSGFVDTRVQPWTKEPMITLADNDFRYMNYFFHDFVSVEDLSPMERLIYGIDFITVP